MKKTPRIITVCIFLVMLGGCASSYKPPPTFGNFNPQDVQTINVLPVIDIRTDSKSNTFSYHLPCLPAYKEACDDEGIPTDSDEFDLDNIIRHQVKMKLKTKGYSVTLSKDKPQRPLGEAMFASPASLEASLGKLSIADKKWIFIILLQDAHIGKVTQVHVVQSGVTVWENALKVRVTGIFINGLTGKEVWRNEADGVLKEGVGATVLGITNSARRELSEPKAIYRLMYGFHKRITK